MFGPAHGPAGTTSLTLHRLSLSTRRSECQIALGKSMPFPWQTPAQQLGSAVPAAPGQGRRRGRYHDQQPDDADHHPDRCARRRRHQTSEQHHDPDNEHDAADNPSALSRMFDRDTGRNPGSSRASIRSISSSLRCSSSDRTVAAPDPTPAPCPCPCPCPCRCRCYGVPILPSCPQGSITTDPRLLPEQWIRGPAARINQSTNNQVLGYPGSGGGPCFAGLLLVRVDGFGDGGR